MEAAVMWTISDFPGLGIFGGLKSKGYKACPMCLDDVDANIWRGEFLTKATVDGLIQIIRGGNKLLSSMRKWNYEMPHLH
ncbi:unnamed protein product [Rhodiola kirilowii]